jgi:hypothetical protein
MILSIARFVSASHYIPFAGSAFSLGLAYYFSTRLKPRQRIILRVIDSKRILTPWGTTISLSSGEARVIVHPCNLYDKSEFYNPLCDYAIGYCCVVLKVNNDEFAIACLRQELVDAYLNEFLYNFPGLKMETGDHVRCYGIRNSWWGRFLSTRLWNS